MITKNQSIRKKITNGYYKTSLSKDKGIYAMCWKKDFDAMVRRGYLEIGVGDAGMKKEEQGDIDSRLNQHCTSKNVFDDLVEIGRWTELKKIIRDHDIFDAVGLIAPRREGVNKAGGRHKYELFRLPVAEAMIKAYDRSGEYDSIKLIAKKALSEIIKDKEKITKIDLIKFRNIQIKVIDWFLKKLKSQGFDMSVVAELCPRIGKTIIFLELFKRINAVNPKFKTMIIQVYGVGLSIFKSYNDEVSKWKDFINMDIIDSSDDDAEQKFKLSQKQGRLQVVLVGLNPDESSRRYQWINQYTGSVVSLLEEADFGCHTDQQVKKTEFLNANKKNIVRINASGTNIGRLAKAMGGNEIFEIIVVPYSEVENDRDSSKNGIVKRRYYNAIFDPKVNQMLEGYDPEALPSIKKILERPWEQEAWLGAVWGDIVGSPTARMRYGMNINQMANEDLKYIMAFQTGTKKSMDQHKEVIEKYCPEHYVLALHGDVAGMNNKTAEQRTKEKIVELKHGMIPGKNKLIVLTNMMGSRSYTVGEISAVLFMQDRGDIDTFIQKSSRVLSPYPGKKFGHIFDFAFDPNKTRNTEMAIVNDAVVTQDIYGGSFPRAIRQVLSCVNLYDMGKGGWQSDDQLVASLEDNNKLLELANCSNKIDIKKIDKKLLDILLKIKNTYNEKEKKKIKQIITGKTYKNGGGSNKGDIDFVLSRVKKAINSLNNSATSVVWFANKIGNTFLECINQIDLHEEAKLDFEKVFSISPTDIKQLVPILPINIYDICVKNSRDGQGQKYATNKDLGILGQGDSKELWNDIISKAVLDARIRYVLKNNGKILIVAGGQGTEVDVLVGKYGKGIVKHLWFNDTIISFTNEVKDKYNKINVIKGDFLGLNIDMEFDVILGNPPYKGQSHLHQKFFNKSVELLKQDGVIGFIQPATVYFNKKEKTDFDSQVMRDNIKNYQTEVEMLKPEIFENALNRNDISITLLKKTKTNKEIDHVIYRSGARFDNISLEDVNRTEIDPKIYRSIVDKYSRLIDQNGCIYNRASTKKTKAKTKLASMRGNRGGDDWYTFIPCDKSYWTTENKDGDWGIDADTHNEAMNIYDFFTTNPARFGLSIHKFSADMHGGAMNKVFNLDFSKSYTDNEIYDILNLSNKERKAIDEILPNYHERSK